MKELFLLLCGGAIGAGLAWLWDDQRGKERRDMVRDRLMVARDELQERAEMARHEMEPKIREARDRFMAQAQSRN